MHYGGYAFSSNGKPTIESKDPKITPEDLGQRNGLSGIDIEELNRYFDCGEWLITLLVFMSV